MAVSAATRGFALELFHDVGGVTARPMMGALALYSHGSIFAIVGSDDRIYIKASGALAGDLAAEGAERFTYARRGGTTSMGYWSLPDPALDDPEAACAWARRALAEAGSGPGRSRAGR
jgi:DNA transformation protein